MTKVCTSLTFLTEGEGWQGCSVVFPKGLAEGDWTPLQSTMQSVRDCLLFQGRETLFFQLFPSVRVSNPLSKIILRTLSQNLQCVLTNELGPITII